MKLKLRLVAFVLLIVIFVGVELPNKKCGCDIKNIPIIDKVSANKWTIVNFSLRNTRANIETKITKQLNRATVSDGFISETEK